MSGVAFAPPSMAQIAAAIIGEGDPLPESATAIGGTLAKAQPFNHQHPRLTSAKAYTLDGTGVQTCMFSRKFTSEPALAILSIKAGGTQPVIFGLDDWIMDGADYAGAIIRGYRLNTSTLAAVTVLGISVAVGGATINPATSTGAAGVRFSLVALMPSA